MVATMPFAFVVQLPTLEGTFPFGLHHFLSALVEDLDRRLLDGMGSRKSLDSVDCKQAVWKYVFCRTHCNNR